MLGQFGGGGDEPDADEASGDEQIEFRRDGETEQKVEVEFGEGIDPLLEGYSGGSREIIANRPMAFGPMPDGSPPYRESDSEEMNLLASFRVRTIFPADVMEEVSKLGQDPPKSDYEDVESREDLRKERIFTIDGADARDFDDAIGIRKIEDGYEVSVHIADVGHYVRPGTAVEAEALARGTSVYLADQVVPMLPEELSNHLCSLVPDRDRLAFSVFMQFDLQGKRKGFYVTKSVIRSMRRCTYQAVQELLDGVDNAATQKIADLKPDLEMFTEWTKKQQLLRDRKGSLRMQSSERKFRFDKEGKVTEIYAATNYFTQTLIEETALAANQAVGDFFKNHGLPTIYRIHPEKDEDEIKQVTKMLEQHGCRVPKKDRLTGRDIGAMIRWARRQSNAEAMIARIMGLMERAVYEVRDHDDRAEHFGLAREHYLHFTSPIRRYPDLIVHRMLWDFLDRGDAAKGDLRDYELLRDLTDVAAHASGQADMSSMAETAVGDLKVCQYMEPKVGEIHRAKVERVSRYGMEVRLDSEMVTGFLPSRTLGMRVKLEGPVLKIQSRQGTRVFREGDTVEVLVKEVDFIKLNVFFELQITKR